MADEQKIAEGLSVLKAKWDSIVPAPDYRQWESGDYRCKVDPASKCFVAGTGKVGFKIKFVVVEPGDYLDRPIYCDRWLVGTAKAPSKQK